MRALARGLSMELLHVTNLFRAHSLRKRHEHEVRPLAQQLPFQIQSWGCFRHQKSKAVSYWLQVNDPGYVPTATSEDRGVTWKWGRVPLLPAWTLTRAFEE